MDESMHPYQYACPLKFLKMAPVACEEWREGVRAYHAKRSRKASQKIEPGTVFRFADGYKDSLGNSLNGVEGKIVRKSGRSYTAEIGYMPIRIQRRHIGEIVSPRESSEEAAD